MKNKFTLIARILLGFVFFASGIAGLFNLVPMPPDLPERMVTFNNGLMATGYFLPFLKITETVCGAFLLTGYFIPLALVILAPIVIHITLVHAFLAPGGLVLAIILGLLLYYLSFHAKPYSVVIRELFKK